MIKLYETNKSYLEELNDIKKLKKVVYTALLGNYDNVHSIHKEKGYDYFMFTDKNLTNKSDLNWTILKIKKINKEHKDSNISIRKRQRFYKTHPHLFFKDYNLSIYVDSTFEIKGKLDEFLLRILTPKKSIYVLEHPDTNSINNEFKAVLQSFKEINKTITYIKNKYNKENFPDNNGLAECCLIVRKHNEINSIKFMDRWFKEIKQNSHRDQLSFNYILWKNMNKDVKYISKKMILKYFNQKPHLIIFKMKDL